MTVPGQDSLKTRRTLTVGGTDYDYFSLAAASDAGLGDIGRLPFSLKTHTLRKPGETLIMTNSKSRFGSAKPFAPYASVHRKLMPP